MFAISSHSALVETHRILRTFDYHVNHLFIRWTCMSYRKPKHPPRRKEMEEPPLHNYNAQISFLSLNALRSKKRRTHPNINTRLPTTLIPLRRHNLIIKDPKRQPKLLPRLKMRLRRYFPSYSLHSANRPELRVTSRPHNRRRIRPLTRVDIISTVICVYRALFYTADTGVVFAVGFDDVVFY